MNEREDDQLFGDKDCFADKSRMQVMGPRVPPCVNLPELDPVMARFEESYKRLLGALAALELKFPQDVTINRMIVNLKDGFESLKETFPGFLRYRDASLCDWPVTHPPPSKPEDILYPDH
jgi:hypothetical protein